MRTCLRRQRPSEQGCNSEKQALQCHWFVQKVGPVFLSGTSNMLILLGRGLEVSLFLPRRIALCWCPFASLQSLCHDMLKKLVGNTIRLCAGSLSALGTSRRQDGFDSANDFFRKS